MRLNYLNQKREDTIPPLLDLLARRTELRDVGIAGYLAGAAVDGAPAHYLPAMKVEPLNTGYLAGRHDTTFRLEFPYLEHFMQFWPGVAA